MAEVGSGVTLGKDVGGFKSVELPYLRVANVQDATSIFRPSRPSVSGWTK